jgi:mannosyltransferase
MSAIAEHRPRGVAQQWAIHGDKLAVAAVVLLAAALRFWGLAHQSFWYDEIATVGVIKGSFWHTFHEVRVSESTPPLYYVLAWLWTRVTGISEAGLRSLSAMFGVLTVVVVWAALRETVSRTAAAAGAAIAAVNPMLVWFAQEARAYSLVTLLGALSLWFALRALRQPTAKRLAAWSVTCCLILLTHYFAVFIVVSELGTMLWLLRDRRREVLVALVPVIVTGLALVPLAHAQEADGRTAWIAGSAIAGRLGDLLRELVSANTSLISSNSASPSSVWAVLGTAGVVLAAAVGVASPAVRRSATMRVVAVIGGAAIAIPLVLSFTPLDYFQDRNLIAAWVPFVAALGGCVALARVRRVAAAALALVVVAGVAVDVEVQRDPGLQRTNWRGAAQLMGAPTVPQAVIVNPSFEEAALAYYGRSLEPMPVGARISAITVVGAGVPLSQPAPPGFAPTLRRRVGALTVLRFRGAHPLTMTRAVIARAHAPVYLELDQATQRWIAAYLADVKSWGQALASLGRSPTAQATLAAAPAATARLAQLPSGLPTAHDLFARLEAAARLAAATAANQTPANRAALQRALAAVFTG